MTAKRTNRKSAKPRVRHPGMTKMHITLPHELAGELKQLAQRRDRPVSSVIRLIVQAEVDRAKAEKSKAA